MTPQIRKIFSDNYHVKLGHFVNFSYIIFGQKCLAPKLTELIRLCKRGQLLSPGNVEKCFVLQKSPFITDGNHVHAHAVELHINMQNAPKFTIFKSKNRKIFWGGGISPPKTLSPVGRKQPFPHPTPSDMRPLPFVPPGKSPTGSHG